MIFYFVGVLALGVMLGILAGGSGSPVVATVMPLVFGLLGGAFAFFVTKTRQSLNVLVPRLRFLGMTLILLSVSLIVSGVYAGLLRTGSSFSQLSAPFTANNAEYSSRQLGNMEMVTKISLFRFLLAGLSLPEGEADRVVKDFIAGATPESITEETRLRVQEGTQLARKLLDCIDNSVKKAKQEGVTIDSSVDVLRYELRLSASLGELASALGRDQVTARIATSDFAASLDASTTKLQENHLGDAVRFIDDECVAAIPSTLITVRSLKNDLKLGKGEEIDAALAVLNQYEVKGGGGGLGESQSGTPLFFRSNPEDQRL